MRYKSFRIRNFKGIKDTTVDLTTVGGAAVFAFVGLNESGKTTVLEAIHSFSPDQATDELVGGEEGAGVPYNERVPRHLISIFSGEVSVTATLEVNAADKRDLIADIRTLTGLIVDADSLCDELVMERYQRFENGDYLGSYIKLHNDVRVKAGRERKWRKPIGDEIASLWKAISRSIPLIAYFPTFVFEFPKAIYLTERGDAIDQFYRRVFQDILDYDGRGHSIEKDIVRRVRGEGKIIPWLQFFADWHQHEDRNKIQHVMDRASAAVTNMVFGRWNRIFHEDTKGKEVVISYEVVEGERQDARGNLSKTQEHDVYITFQIRDGTRRFNVNDRSLGFRWFFAFMLFTQFRVSRNSGRPLLFLFDEPASNLHAAAQQKLIESFPEIAKGDHMLGYTTHSHYMIEPKWLEQTFIVTNRADAPADSVMDAVSLDDESLDIKVATYRSFVNDHPNQTSYFQPILDRLKVGPSRFDIQRNSIILEGKSDYYILRYAAVATGNSVMPLLPGLGAGTFGALIALHIGWSLHFIFVLDGDKQGKEERERYIKEFCISPDRIVTINSFVPHVKVIEDLLDADALEFIRIALKLPTPPSKGQIRRFFQERLASGNVEPLSPGFLAAATAMVDAIQNKLDASAAVHGTGLVAE